MNTTTIKKIVMKYLTLFLLLWIFTQPTSLYGQQNSKDTLRVTLADCFHYAMKHNNNRQIKLLAEDASIDQYKQSKQERLPNVSFSFNETLSNSKYNHGAWNGYYSMNTEMFLYQGGRISETIRQNELLSKRTELDTQQFDNELVINIMHAFLTALGNNELFSYQQSVLQASTEQVRQGYERYKVEEIIESDYLLLEAQLAGDRSNIFETEIALENSLSALKNLLSIDPLQPMQIIYPDTDDIYAMLSLPSQEYVLERSLTTLPDLYISNYNVEIAESGLRISRSSLYPTISLNGSIESSHLNNYSGFSNQLNNRLNEQIGISINIPVFNKRRAKSGIVQSEIALKQAELNHKQTELDIQQTILQEYREVLSAANRFEASQIKQNAYLKSFDSYRAKFNVSAITTVELLQQQNNYINALNEYIQSKYNFLLKRMILNVYMGETLDM